MTFERRSPRDYLSEVRGGSASRRWQAAFELSRRIGAHGAGAGAGRPRRRDASGSSSRSRLRAPRTSRCAGTSCSSWGGWGTGPRCRRCSAAPKDPDPETRLYAVWALGMLGDPRGRRRRAGGVPLARTPECARWRRTSSASSGTRAAVPRLQVLLEDRVPDVRWNAAIALATLGDRSGLAVLRSMVDREALARQARDLERPGGSGDGQRAQSARAAQGSREPAAPGEGRARRPESSRARRGAAAPRRRRAGSAAAESP